MTTARTRGSGSSRGRRPPISPCRWCGWKPRRGKLWPSHGRLGVRWIHDNLIFTEGDFFGRPFRCRPDQQEFLWRWYEWCDGCGRWRYQRGLKSAAKGDGKTELIAAIGCLEFAGPPPIAPTGTSTPEVIVAAAALKQAGELFGAAGMMLGGRGNSVREAPLCGLFEVYDTEIRFADGRPGRIMRAAAEAGTIDGTNATLFLADELHEWGDIGDRKARVHTVVANSLAKRKRPGRELNLSTAGADIDHSLLGAMVKHARKVLRDPRIDPTLLVDIREAPDGLDYTRPEDREVAVRAASAAAGIQWPVADRVDRWNRPEVKPHEWIRYYANRWVPAGAEDSWLADHEGAWPACQGGWRSKPEHPFVLAVDMALKHDSVAVVRVEQVAGGRFAVTARIWEPAGGRIDHLEVFRWVAEQARGTGFRGVVYDPRFFEVPARMLEEQGVLAVEFNQQPQFMAPACGLALQLVLGRKIVHNGDPKLAEHVLAAKKRETDRGFTLSKGRSGKHIDAAVAMCMGLWILQSAPPDPKPSVYEERGLIVL